MLPKTKNYSIVDPIKSSLDETVIKNDTINPKLREKITQAVEKIERELKLAVKKTWVIGSSLTYQWTPTSDIDVNLFIEEKDADRVKELNKILYDEYNEKLFLGKHPINFHFTGGRYPKFKADAIFDITSNKWIKKPQALSEDDIEELIKGCASLQEFSDILKEYIKLQKLIESYNGQEDSLNEIFEQAFTVNNLFEKIRDIRREEFKKRPEKGMHSANERCSNVIFKLLEQYGLGNLSKEIANFIKLRLDN